MGNSKFSKLLTVKFKERENWIDIAWLKYKFINLKENYLFRFPEI